MGSKEVARKFKSDRARKQKVDNNWPPATDTTKHANNTTHVHPRMNEETYFELSLTKLDFDTFFAVSALVACPLFPVSPDREASISSDFMSRGEVVWLK